MVDRVVVRFLGQVVWVAVALIVLWFSLAGAGFVMATGEWLLRLLAGRGPDRPEEAAATFGVAVFAFVMALSAFATISLPGFWFVAYTVRAFWRHETDWIRQYD